MPDYSIKTAETYRQRRNTVLRLLGGKCVRCGFGDPRALQIDHVKGDGCNTPFRDYRKAIKIIRALPGIYQLLCANCNWIKRAERGEHRTSNGRGGAATTELQKARQVAPLATINLLLGVCADCGFPVSDNDVDMSS
jgi:predicted Zn-ribbon and HTH transcriptional regulator